MQELGQTIEPTLTSLQEQFLRFGDKGMASCGLAGFASLRLRTHSIRELSGNEVMWPSLITLINSKRK